MARKPEKVLIALSAGRTGTKALVYWLNKGFEGVRAVHEPGPSWRLRVASNRYLAGRSSREQMARLLVSTRRRLCAKPGQPVYVESNGLLHGFLEVLARAFHQPRVLHLVRDPRTYVPSALNFGGQSGLKRLFSAFVPFWVLKPEHFEPRPAKTWRGMDDVERFAWLWRVINLHLDRGETLFGEHYRRLRFEDLVAEDGSGIRAVASWMGLVEKPRALAGLGGRKVNASRRRRVPQWEAWSALERRRLLRHCGDLLEHYGYSD